MAETRPDILGRMVEFEGAFEDFLDRLQKMMSGKVGAPKPYNAGKTGDAKGSAKDITDILSSIDDTLDETLGECKTFFEEVVKGHAEQRKKMEATKRGGGVQNRETVSQGGIGKGINALLEGIADPVSALQKVMTPAMRGGMGSGEIVFPTDISKATVGMTHSLESFVSAALHPGSIYTHDIHLEALLEKVFGKPLPVIDHEAAKQLEAALGSKTTGAPAGAAGAAGGGPLAKAMDEAANASAQVSAGTKTAGMHIQQASKKTRDWSAGMAAVGSTVFNLMGGMNNMRYVFGDLYEQEQLFRRDMRNIAFQIDGITGNTKKLQKEWTEVGKQAAQTGVGLTKFQQVLTENLKKGIKSRKEEIAITKTGLNLSTMIGSNAEATANEMSDWGRQLQMNNAQLAEYSRATQRISRATGVTGDNLLRAVQAAKAIVVELRNAANLSASAAENVTAITAAAEKRGVGAQAAGLMKDMSSSANLFLNASDQAKTLLFQGAAYVGRLDELRTGTILQTKAGMKDMSKGLEMILANFGTTFDSLDTLSPERLGALNIQLQSAYGMQAGQLKELYNSMKEGSQTFEEQMTKLNKELQSGNLTTQERIKLEERKRKMEMDEGFKFLTAFDEQGRKAGMDMATAASTALKKLGPEFQQEMKSIGVDLSDPVKGLAAAGEYTAKKIKEAGGKDFSSAISKAVGSKDIGAVREVLEQMNAEQQKLGVKEKAALDPMNGILQATNEMNETLRGFTGPALDSLRQMVGKTGAIAMYLGSMALGSMGSGGLLSSAFGGLKSLMGKRGGEGVSASEVVDAVKGLPKQIGKVSFKDGVKKFMTPLFHHQFGKAEAGGAAPAAAPAAGGGGGMLGEGIKVPEMNFDLAGMKKAGPKLAKAAASLAIVAVGVVAAATAILYIASKIIHIAGISPTDALAVGAMIAGTLGAMVAITYAIKNAEAMPDIKFSDFKTLGMKLLKGAVALMILVPGIVLLGTALVYISKAIMGAFGLSGDEAAKVAEDVGRLLWATAKITLSVIVAAAALVGLGWALTATGGWGLLAIAGLMLAGAAALMILTPAVVLLATAVVGLCEKIMSSTGIDGSEASKAADSIGTLLWSAGKIAGSVLLSAAVLAVLGAAAPVLWWAIPLMLMGTAALMALTPAIVGLAAVIVKMTQSLMGLIGVDAGVASEAAKNLAGILTAASDIAGAVIWSSVKLTVLGLLSSVAWAMVPFMFAGAAALAVLGAPVVALAAAIVFISKMLTSILDPETSKGAVEGLSAILDGAASITNSILGSAVKLTLLGLLYPLAWGLALLMLKGAAAFAILAVPVVAFSSAIMGLAMVMTNMFPQEDAKKMAEGMTAIFNATDTVTNAIYKQMPALLGLGLLLPFVGFIAGLMYAGAAAFTALAAPVVAFVKSIVDIAVDLSKKVSIRDAEDMAKLMGGVAKVIDQVANVMNTVNDKLVTLTKGSWFGLGKSVLQKIVDAIPQIRATFEAVSRMVSEGIIGPLKNHFPVPNNVKVAAQVMRDMASVLEGVARAMDVMGSKLQPLTEHSWFGLGSSPMEKITGSIPELQGALEAIAAFIDQGIVEPLKKKFPKPGNIAVAAYVMKHIASLMENTGKAMGVMAEKLLPLTKNKWWGGKSPLRQMEGATPQLRKGLEAIADFVKDGIVRPVTNRFGEGTALKIAAQIMVSMSKVMEGVGKSFDVMAKSLLPLVSGRIARFFGNDLKSKIEKARPQLEQGFTEIAKFVNDGIINSLKTNFPNLNNLALAVKVIGMLSQLILGVGRSFSIMMKVMVPLTSGGLFRTAPIEDIKKATSAFGEHFKVIAGFLKDGIVVPLEGIFQDEGKIAAEKLENLQLLIGKLPGLLGYIGSTFGPMVDGGILKTMPIEGIRSTTQKFAEVFGGISELLKDGVVAPISKLPDSKQLEEAEKRLDSLYKILTRISEIMGALQGIANQMAATKIDNMDQVVDNINKVLTSLSAIRAENLGVDVVAGGFNAAGAEVVAGSAADNVVTTGGVGAAAIPVGFRGTVADTAAAEPADISAMPLTDVYDQMTSERAGTEAKVGAGGGRDMAAVAAATEQNAAYLAMIHQDMRELIDIMSGQSARGGGNKPSTRSQRRVPMAAPNFNEWQAGGITSNGSRNVNSIGV